MTKRGIVSFIIFSIITCGIYDLYWLVVTQSELNASDSEKGFGGFMCLFLSIITCSIYYFYWMYCMGQRVGKKSGNSSLGVINLILTLFGFGLIGHALVQNDMNQIK